MSNTELSHVTQKQMFNMIFVITCRSKRRFGWHQPSQVFFWYDTDKRIVLCCLYRLYLIAGVIPKEGLAGLISLLVLWQERSYKGCFLCMTAQLTNWHRHLVLQYWIFNRGNSWSSASVRTLQSAEHACVNFIRVFHLWHWEWLPTQRTLKIEISCR